MNISERQEVARRFSNNREKYEQYCSQVTELLNALCNKNSVHVISSRVKTEESFYSKAILRGTGKSFKYEDPLNQIEDLVGLRVICFTLQQVDEICEVIKLNFDVTEVIDKAAELIKKGQIGYVSKHFVVKLNRARASLPEYATVSDMKCEIQVRTVFQNAWAELEHRLQYKSSPNPELRSRFQALAGLVQVADREFDGVVDLGNKLVLENKDTVESIDDDYDLSDDEGSEAGHKLSDAAYMFGIRPRDLVAEERYDDAIMAYNNLIALQPNQVWHFVGRAKAKALLGDKNAVQEDINSIEQIASTDARVKKALKDLRKIVK